MTEPITTPPVDLEPVKRKQQATWASGDYSAVAALIPIISEDLCDAADLRAGSRVLDVAGGSGNTALAAARMFCDVVSLDYVRRCSSVGANAPRRSGFPFASSRAMPRRCRS